MRLRVIVSLLFTNPATTELYTLSLHDALPILTHEAGIAGRRILGDRRPDGAVRGAAQLVHGVALPQRDRKSTRLNSSHQINSYAVFCLKKKKNAPSRGLPQYPEHASCSLVLPE